MDNLKNKHFYWHKDNSRVKRHPCYLFKKRKKKNQYYILCFTHHPVRGEESNYERLEKNIDINDSRISYIDKRKRIVGRNEIELSSYKYPKNKNDKKLFKRIMKN